MNSNLWKIKAGRVNVEEFYVAAPTFKKACEAAVHGLTSVKGETYRATLDDLMHVEWVRPVRVVS